MTGDLAPADCLAGWIAVPVHQSGIFHLPKTPLVPSPQIQGRNMTTDYLGDYNIINNHSTTPMVVADNNIDTGDIIAYDTDNDDEMLVRYPLIRSYFPSV